MVTSHTNVSSSAARNIVILWLLGEGRDRCSLSYRMARFGKILVGEAEDKTVVCKPSDQSSDRQPYPESVPTAAEV